MPPDCDGACRTTDIVGRFITTASGVAISSGLSRSPGAGLNWTSEGGEMDASKEAIERGYPDLQPEEQPPVAAAPGQHEPGAKLDGGKPDTSLLQLFPRALLEVARVGTYGKLKYTRGGWQYVPEGVERYTAAMLRHFFAEEIEGPLDSDPMLEEYGFDGQILHAAQVAWNALARLELQLRGGEQNGE